MTLLKVIQCDNCGQVSGLGSKTTEAVAINLAIEDGFAINKDGRDLCQECSNDPN